MSVYFNENPKYEIPGKSFFWMPRCSMKTVW